MFGLFGYLYFNSDDDYSCNNTEFFKLRKEQNVDLTLQPIIEEKTNYGVRVNISLDLDFNSQEEANEFQNSLNVVWKTLVKRLQKGEIRW